ncbi:MAG TPA: LON peptidase substrate-binding domain-containing protein [Candidatus Xenobia bacterium]|nr:LON peptidase substrate-binding domain-containing protein [Candidatus Xenobia bacterium]
MGSEWLPLFPLEVVLFPGADLPLHIFEPRYRLMTRLCREQKREFGVVLVRTQGVSRIGCTAEIVSVTREYPDGRSDLLARGRRRFLLRAVSDELEYLQGDVEFLADREGPLDTEGRARLLATFNDVFRFLLQRNPPPLAELEELRLSYRLAELLPLELDFKQALLEMDSEAERRESLRERLEAWRTELEVVQRRRRKASGNGQGR